MKHKNEKHDKQEQQEKDAPSQNDLLPLSLEKAQKRPFPPGCPVIYMESEKRKVTTSVDSILVDMSSSKDPSYVYRLQNGADALEAQLQYASTCPAWVYDKEWTECVVWSSYQESPSSKALYSVQQVGTGALFHGVPKEYISYRQEVSSGEPNMLETSTSMDGQRDSTYSDEYFSQHAGVETLESHQYERRDGSKMHADHARGASMERKRPLDVTHSFGNENVSMPKTKHNNYMASHTDEEENDKYNTMHNPEENKDSKVFTADFFVPRMELFSLEDLKLFNHQHTQYIMDNTNCSIHLRSTSSDHCVRFELTGTVQEIDAASNLLEELLICAVDHDSAPRALYFLALWNGHRRKQGQIVHQASLRDYSRKKWMYCSELPRDFQTYSSLVIGKGGKRKKRLEHQTRCRIDLNIEDKVPHYYIYGDSVDSVNECIDLLERAMANSKRSKEAEHKRRY